MNEREITAAAAVAVATAAVRCCVCVHALFPASLCAFGLSITAPPPSSSCPPAVHAHVHIRPTNRRCVFASFLFAWNASMRVRVGEIVSSVRNGACAPYAAFFFAVEGIEVNRRDGANRARRRCIRNFTFGWCERRSREITRKINTTEVVVSREITSYVCPSCYSA